MVDPQRDVDIYLKAAEERGVKILHMLKLICTPFLFPDTKSWPRVPEQNLHRTNAGAKFPHIAVQDGFELRAGKLLLKVLDTPGHTPKAYAILITDEEKSFNPWAVLTGDTLSGRCRTARSFDHTPLRRNWEACSTTVCIASCSRSRTKY